MDKETFLKGMIINGLLSGRKYYDSEQLVDETNRYYEKLTTGPDEEVESANKIRLKDLDPTKYKESRLISSDGKPVDTYGSSGTLTPADPDNEKPAIIKGRSWITGEATNKLKSEYESIKNKKND